MPHEFPRISRIIRAISEPIVVPPFKDNCRKVTIVRWLVDPEPGDFQRNQPIVELSNGDILKAPFTGRLWKRLPEGTEVQQGDEIALITEKQPTSRFTLPVNLIDLSFQRPPAAEMKYPRVHPTEDSKDQVQPEREFMLHQNTIIIGTDVDTQRPVTVTTKELCSGCYVLGVQGVGKSSMLVEIARQLLEKGESVIVFDPHGSLIDEIVRRMPQERVADTYHLNLKDRTYPFALNVFACANPDSEEDRDRTRNQVMHAFEKIWPETSSGVYFKKLLPHVVILLIEHPHLTLADIPRLLNDEAFRQQYTHDLKNLGSRNFWQYTYDKLSPSVQQRQAEPLLTRVQELLAEPVITRILCQPQSSINIRSLIEQRKNLLVRLPINEDAYANAAGLVGTMLMAMVYAATFSFTDVPEERRPGFTLIVDEFQNFATDEYARLFAQGRKFRARQFLAHQYRDQLAGTSMEANKSATLTAYTKVIFTVTKPDAQALADDFVPFEKRRKVANIDPLPTDSMDKHPTQAVKEFAIKYIWKLQAGARANIRTTGNRFFPDVIMPRMDFGAGTRDFRPGDCSNVLAQLNKVFYEGQRDGAFNEEAVNALLEALKPLLGHTPEIREFWDDPAAEKRYNKAKRGYKEALEQLRTLEKQKPPDSSRFGHGISYSIGTDASYDRYVVDIHSIPRDAYKALEEDIRNNASVALCLPSWEWIREKWMTGYYKTHFARSTTESVSEDGLIPYRYIGDEVSLVELLSFSFPGMGSEVRLQGQRLINEWLRTEVTFWAEKAPRVGLLRRQYASVGRVMRVTYRAEPNKFYEWLRSTLVDEARQTRKRLRENLTAWEQQIAELRRGVALGDKCGVIRNVHFKTERVEQRELAEFREALDPVLAALLDEPITIGQSTVTSKDVAQVLQHQERQQAYVRIGTRAHVMRTLPLSKPVPDVEAHRRFDRLQRQTRRDLCRPAPPQQGSPPEPPTTPPQPPDSPPPPPKPGRGRFRPLD